MTEVRSPGIVSEPLSSGSPNVRESNVVSEPLSSGSPNVRDALFISEPLSSGNPNIRDALFVVESLVEIIKEGPVSNEIFPDQSVLPGLSYSVHKKPRFDTRKATSVSGRNVRNAMMQFPIWTFELTYDYLPDHPVSVGQTALRTLVGFWLQRLAGYDTFLFKDVDDYKVIGQEIAVGDAVTLQFPLVRSFGGFVEPVGQLNTAVARTFYANGVPLVLGTDYNISMPNQIVFLVAPAVGVVITGDFEYYFVCTFVDDEADFEKFMDKLWQLQKLDFESIIQ